MDYDKLSLQLHQQYKGKVAIQSKVPLHSQEDLSIYYTPWVAAPCLAIAQNPQLAYQYTRKGNTIAVISDGTAVLGLGNIGWLAWLPVMEGKAILFKEFGWVDAIPIILKTQDPDEIIMIIENIAPTFGAINLEDIKAPQCFYIEEELKKRCDIPILHDDQHGAAIVVLAWLINALPLAQKKIADIKIVIAGAGAAGIAITKLLSSYGANNIVLLDSQGATCSVRQWLNPYKLATQRLNKDDQCWSLEEVIINADVFIGVSKANILTPGHIQQMNHHPIVFALSNPNPEIEPHLALQAGVFILATGRSDFPNQINNVLAFPGLMRGALDAKITQFEQKHFIAAAHAIATHQPHPTPTHIMPSLLDKTVASAVAQAVMSA